MKYLSVVLALCLCLTVAVNAENNPTKNLRATVTAVENKTVEISLVNLQQLRTDISIQSVDGDVTYFQDVVKKHNAYRKRLNLSELKAGKYMLVVLNGDEKLQQVIVVKGDNTMLLSIIK